MHPAVLHAYLDGDLAAALEASVEGLLRRELRALRRDEAAVVRLLARRLKRERKAKRPARKVTLH